MKDVANFFAALLVGLFMFAIGLAVGVRGQQSYDEKAAVKHGAAEFVIVDPKTGRTEFRWKETGAGGAE